ncbi:MAG: S-adenosylmethionine decarboxylase [Veillonellaceae bacterium]|nr:S-adenosylmethionine decarboxylase [Veillonellaceae bacterium]
MTQSIGKHILIDCYGCRAARIDSPASLQAAVSEAMAELLSDNYDTHVHAHPEGYSMTAIGMNSHICLHAYPDYDYVAVDVFTFDTLIEATATMKIFRQHFRPDKIRATSVKRGKVEPARDMKPKTNSKTTQWRRMKTTGKRIKTTGGKVLKVLRPGRQSK